MADAMRTLPDAELEVMQTIWTLTPPVTAAEVQQHASSDWKMRFWTGRTRWRRRRC